MKSLKGIFAVLIAIAVLGVAGVKDNNLIDVNSNQYENYEGASTEKNVLQDRQGQSWNTNAPDYLDLDSLPEYSSEPYCVVNSNVPFFTDDELTTKSYERFSDLDELGRCGVVEASIGQDLMPTEDRENIGMVKPTGWQVAKYDDIDGNYLYNRCHLIGFQLTGENANERNLITGTRYMNVQGMLPFENEVAEYVRETNNHVMYRVTPIFGDDNLVAFGVLMEAKSVEDDGEGILFNVFCYNVQPNIIIDYTNGNSAGPVYEGTTVTHDKNADNNINNDANDNINNTMGEFVLNTSSKKIHLPSCDGIKTMSEKNKESYNGNINDLISKGYERCKQCNP